MITNPKQIVSLILIAASLAGFCFADASMMSTEASAKEPAVEFDWQWCGWGGGGFYQASVFHPVKEGVIYMSGDVAGVYKTEDFGKQWRMINHGLTSHEVYSLAIDPKNPETIYASTVLGLSKSTDGGEHWTTSPNTGPKQLAIIGQRNKTIHSIAVDPANSNVVYASTPAGKIYKSEDGTQTWSVVYALKQAGAIYSVAVNPKKTSQVLGATQTAGIVLSDDGGKTWTELNTPANAAHVAVAPGDGKTLYGSFFTNGVHKSVDGGQTWTPCDPDAKNKARVIQVSVDSSDPNRVYCISSSEWTGRFFASNDGGVTWSENSRIKPNYKEDPTLPDEPRQNGLIPMSGLAALAINPNNPDHLYISGNWRSVFSNDGGKTWEERVHGADITCFSDIRFSGNRAYATAMDEGLLVSDNAGSSWSQVWPRAYEQNLSGHNWQVSVTQNKGVDRIVSTVTPWNKTVRNNAVVISEDGGKTNKISDAGLPDYMPKLNTMWGEGYMRALTVDPNNPKILYAGIDGDAEAGKRGGGVFKSGDGGYTWKQLPNQPGSRRMFYGLAVDPTDSNRIYWGGCGKDGGLWRTEDGGNSWEKVFAGETWIWNAVAGKDGAAYCTGKNVWRSVDQGNTWQQISHFSNNRSLSGLQVHPDNPKIIWISATNWSTDTDGAIYKTIDGGATWQDITGNIPYRKPIVLRYNPVTSELWAAGVTLFKLKQ
ncbi:MAG TPA: hypothetical protein VK985_04340 [Rariglobus sp.]|nr:hypothetical protein [Rariglobus sp.]